LVLPDNLGRIGNSDITASLRRGAYEIDKIFLGC
jgi:hypothetical protein